MQTESRTTVSSIGSTPQRSRSIVVWDAAVRIFHWSVVAGFAINMFITEEGKPVHRWIGYAILAAVAFRIVWGFIGSPHARFSDFVPTPSRLKAYVAALLKGHEPRYIGHNPAAAVMILGLIGLLVFCGITGWMQGLDAFWGEEWVKVLHEGSAYLILGLALLHVTAAIIESVRHKENLVWSMVTGRKRAPDANDVDHAPASRGK
jgi:cytochrome b